MSAAGSAAAVRGRGAFPLVLLAIAAAAAAVAGAISSQVLGGVPHVADEVSYAFQGRVFASGAAVLEPPPLPALFGYENVILDGERWASIYPPGWPALLALGWLAGVPWLAGPLALAGAVAATGWLGRELFGERTALLGAGLLAASPFALLMGAGWMAHTPTLALGMACLASLARACRVDREARWLVIAGVLGGAATAVRPVSAAALLLPAAVWTLARPPRPAATSRPSGTGSGFGASARRRALRLAALGLGAAVPAALVLAYQATAFGDAFALGYRAAYADHWLTGRGGEHLPLLAVATHHLPWYLGQLSRCLWSLPVPDLLLLLPLVIPVPGRRHDALLATCAGCLLAVHVLYFWADVVYGGPRLAFESLGPIALLVARALERLGPMGAAAARRVLGPGAPVRLLTALGLALLAWFPLGRRLPAEVAALSDAYHGAPSHVVGSLAAAGVGPAALVFVAGAPPVFGPFLVAQELPPGTGGRVFVRDVPPLRAAAAATWPRPELWRVAVRLRPLAGPNLYRDRFAVDEVTWERLDPALLAGAP